MMKKISFGTISLPANKQQEPAKGEHYSGFGIIQSNSIKPESKKDDDVKPPNSKPHKQARSFDIDKMMSEFNVNVEKTRISEASKIINSNEDDDKDISTLMGFSDFGKKSKAKVVKKPTAVEIPKPDKTIDSNKVSEDDSSDSDDNMPYHDPKETNEAANLPLSHEIKLNHSVKAVSGLALDPAGARLVTGSQDFDVKFWDFNAMDSRFQSFRTIQPMENYHIRSMEYSITGDSILIAGGGSQAQVLDRDGSQIYECRKGDQYIVDMARTNGHVSALYNAVWHTKDRNIFMTCSSDCTVRLWDINVTIHQKTVIKMKGSNGKKISPTHSIFNKDSSMIAVVTIDGALSLFPSKGPFVRPKLRNKTAHTNGTETSCLKFSADGSKLLSRGGDDTLKLWDIRNITKPLHIADDLENVFIGTDCWFSPDEKVVMTGTSVKRGSGDLVFFDINTFKQIYRFSLGESSVSKILWHPKLNQIVAGCSNGIVKVYYSPELSSRGALLCAAKPRRRQAKNDEIPTGLSEQIITPYSLPMFRENRFLYAKRRKDKARRDLIKSAAPDKPAWGLDAHKTKGCSMSAYVSKQLALDVHGPPAEEEDPRDAILRYAEVCEKDPYWIAPAYGPESKNVYQEVTEETLSEEPVPKKPMYFYNK